MKGDVRRSTVRQRRNDGRPLLCVIESADNGSYGALEDLSQLTRAWLDSMGYDVIAWPEPVHEVLHGARPARRWVREDDHGQRHTFGVVDLGETDVLFGVSSRRQRNVAGQLTENLATNLLIELLATPGLNSERLYGLLGAVHSGRLLRRGVPGAHLIDVCREWDVVLHCQDLHVDPLVDPSPYAALIALAQELGKRRPPHQELLGSPHRGPPERGVQVVPSRHAPGRLGAPGDAGHVLGQRGRRRPP